MKPRVLAGCILLVVLSIATFATTRSLVAQAGRSGADTTPRASTRAAILNADDLDGGHRERFSRNVDPNEPAPIPRHEAGETYEASMTNKGLDIHVDGRDVQVVARVGIWESIPELDYVWCLRLWTATHNPKDKQLLDERYYHDQQFALTYEQNALNPTFAERLTLAPGRYRVEAKLFGFPRGFDHTTLKPGVDSPSGSGMGGSREIVVD